MILQLPAVFIPEGASFAVQKLRAELKVREAALKVPVQTERDARERNCYVNVRNRIEREGGKVQLGWAVWQHSNLFVEGEPHAVLDSSRGTWIDCTPHVLPDGSQCTEILFIPDHKSSYDFESDELKDNVRVALVNDSRVSDALELFSRATSLMNTVPGFDVELPAETAREVTTLQFRASALLSQCAVAQQHKVRGKIGRNEPCPCGNAMKYKKCHGA
jgi:SEC-C motif